MTAPQPPSKPFSAPSFDLWRRTPCKEFAGYRHPAGYGVKFRAGKTHQAHRLAWADANGPIPPGLKVCHHCDNRACVEVAHLWLGTQKDNMGDCSRKRRFPDRSGSRNIRAKLTEAQVREIRERFGGPDRTLTHKAIAELYSIRKSSVSNILLGKSWVHV